MLVGRWWVVAVLAAAACSVVGCAGESGSPGAGTTTLVSLPGVGSLVPAPTVTVGGDRRAGDVVAAAQDRLPMSPKEASCVEVRLAADAGLLDRLSGGLVVGSPDFGALGEVVAGCKLSVSFAPRFASGVRTGSGEPVSAEQRACLEREFGSLSRDEVAAAQSAGMDPNGTLVERGKSVVQKVLDDCDVR